ncbi:DUF6470 family protein [Alkalihalobacillus trypoxylicola]|uniref:Uncharacterized protein n=1 Tax=Alkalihalobacillus trypoxylicola TaxID=519424 RepID=A0A161PJX2_9BACI|nr:DUF6470 family protein [Alkalihalobacillus trypoxylicola]KYG33697.1 hypothetical protein AZF04_15850 [Alkalihalobacillus trypoxylicola]
MNFPRLHINQQNASIAINKYEPPVQIKQHSANMQIDQRRGDYVRMHSTSSQLFIDQSLAFADAHLKSPLNMASEYYQKMTSSVFSFISKKINEGKQLAAIENGRNAFSDIAKAANQPPMKKSNITYMPKSMDRVKFDFVPGTVHFNVPSGEIDVYVQRRDPEIFFPKWKSDVYVKQKNQIAFEVIGANINKGL